MGVPFIKMHGLGNDFVVVDARAAPIALSEDQVRRIADRHRGVGFDQLILIEPAASGSDADVALAFRNADGSSAGACGNGTRCVARLLLEEQGRDALVLATAGGLVRARRAAGGRTTVAMAAPRFGWQEVPLAEPCDPSVLPIPLPAELAGWAQPMALSLGNPHAVLVGGSLDGIDVERLGAGLHRHPIFPDRANIGFLAPLGAGRLRLRVFERGAGLTLACGSGACAALVVAVRKGLVAEAATLVMDGGELDVAWDGRGPVVMTGATATVFTGHLSPELLGVAELSRARPTAVGAPS